MKISKNFDLDEFTKSETASSKHIDNSIQTEEQLNALTNLIVNLLQPIRDLYGKPMKVNSGFRCAELNKLVGGVQSSQHTLGEAADIACDDPEGLKNLLLNSNIEFDQCGVYKHFVHLSLKVKGNDRNHVFKGNY